MSDSRPFRSVSTVAEGLLSPLLPLLLLLAAPFIVDQKPFVTGGRCSNGRYSRSAPQVRFPFKILTTRISDRAFPNRRPKWRKKTQEAIERLKLAFRRRRSLSIYPPRNKTVPSTVMTGSTSNHPRAGESRGPSPSFSGRRAARPA